MARGGCSSCFSGGSASVPTMIYLIISFGVFLIIMGIVMKNKDILDISINPVSRDAMNDYLGYGSMIIGVVLLFIAGMTMSRMA